MRTSTPYYDMTFSAEKSVSLLYAGLLAAAQQARDQGDEQEAERFRAEAERVEAAVMAGADRMLELAGQRGAIVRTGHHSASSGAFRDAEGLVAVKFLQHTSRAGDPQLHVQATVLNKAQRADRSETGDNKWRALNGRQLMTSGPRLGFAAHAGAAEAQALARLGLPLVKREDGNGFEIGGIGAETIAAYSSRAARIEEQLAELLIEYRQIYGRAPDRAALYKLRKRVTLETRTAKARPKQGGTETQEDRARAAEETLAGWIRKARDASVQELASLRAAAGTYALEHPEAAPGRLPGPAERNRAIRAAIAEAQRQHPTWTRAHLEWELYRQMPVLPAVADWCAYLDAMADDALAGRIPDTDVIRIAPVPDLVDVSSLDHRKDGTSVYRPPGQERFATAAHLDTEEWILEKASRGAVPQLVTEGRAAAALAGTDLDPQQHRAVTGMLTTGGSSPAWSPGRDREDPRDGRVQHGVGAAHRRPGHLPDPVGERRPGRRRGGVHRGLEHRPVLREQGAGRPGGRPGGRRGLPGIHHGPGPDLLARPAGRGAGDRRRRHPAAARGGGRRPVLAHRPPGRALEADRGPPVHPGVGAGRFGPARRRRRDGAGRVRCPRPDLGRPAGPRLRRRGGPVHKRRRARQAGAAAGGQQRGGCPAGPAGPGPADRAGPGRRQARGHAQGRKPGRGR
jgi:conjugative relaxase-like TrwC/TraI family protein